MFDREKMSLLLSRSGLLRALEYLPAAPGLIVFNHHRIGDREGCAYDRGLFSASAEQFEAQVKYIQRHYPVLLPHQLAEVIARKESLSRMHAMISFIAAGAISHDANLAWFSVNVTKVQANATRAWLNMIRPGSGQ